MEVASHAITSKPNAVRHALDAIAFLDSAICAWTHVAAPPPQTADASGAGALAGIPFGVKDNIDVAGMPTRCGSAVFDAEPALFDASCVAQLRLAGAVPIGKTVTTEFAFETPGPTRNPAALNHTPGGSSSGSAAAVAAGMVPFALGTQTGGSLIRPAAFCGVAGFKPTFGLVSRAGMTVNCASLDVVGWYGGNMQVVEAVGHALLSPGSARPTVRAVAQLRVAVLDEIPGHEIESESAAAVRNAGDALARHGVEVGNACLAIAPRLLAAHAVLMRYELARTLLPLLSQCGHLLSRPLQQAIAHGLALPVGKYMDTLNWQAQLRMQWADWFGDCDLVLTSSALGPAPLGLEDTGDAAFNKGWSVLGWPCLHLPTAASRGGLPLGVLLVGRPGSDLDLMAWGRALHPMIDTRPITGRDATTIHDARKSI